MPGVAYGRRLGLVIMAEELGHRGRRWRNELKRPPPAVIVPRGSSVRIACPKRVCAELAPLKPSISLRPDHNDPDSKALYPSPFDTNVIENERLLTTGRSGAFV